jgi:hypothetical protein
MHASRQDSEGRRASTARLDRHHITTKMKGQIHIAAYHTLEQYDTQSRQAQAYSAMIVSERYKLMPRGLSRSSRVTYV